MTAHARPYANSDDFAAMCNLLRANKRAIPTSGYHIGDLNWWVFYDPSDIATREKAVLWHDEDQMLIGWALLHWDNGSSDLAVHHTIRGTAHEAAILTEAMALLEQRTRNQPDAPTEISTLTFADETTRIALLDSLGFTGETYLVYLMQDLNRPLPAPAPPTGYTFLDSMQPEYADLRADVHRQAFAATSRLTGAYYRQFMPAPDYDPELDVVLVAPDGRFAAYAMTWFDQANALGGFEPVGTRPELQGRGLGKAVQYEALRRLQLRGAQTAQVITGADQPNNIAFYQSVGFRPVNTLLLHRKKLS